MGGETVEARLAERMQAAQEGDAVAYRQLLRDCVPVIARTVRGLGLPPDRVEDVVQETLLTIHRARATYDPARPFLPWLRAIARRRAIDAARLTGRQGAREVHDPEAYEGYASDGDAASEAIERQDRARLVGEAVAALPAGQRQAVEHLALADRSLDEAAALTGRSKGALKVNLHRALKALRTRFGGEPGEDV
ncbi:MAG TPA: sigma-70 family RNA polymerase sigma factor [Acetobacteraceae bacterium]|nr:sigma-70 family RNA polymerase sigma factor [Acetobacteraceae bacterium]